VSGSGISWAICKSAPRSRKITTPGPTIQFLAGQMPFLPPNQQCQSTEGIRLDKKFITITVIIKLLDCTKKSMSICTFHYTIKKYPTYLSAHSIKQWNISKQLAKAVSNPNI